MPWWLKCSCPNEHKDAESSAEGERQDGMPEVRRDRMWVRATEHREQRSSEAPFSHGSAFMA
jgi:hypothetical protein